jgi:hypothetical protein
MKKIIKIMLLLLSINSVAQNQIRLIENTDVGTSIQLGDYIQDANGLLNPYVGTWLYTNGNTSLKIIFKKAINNNNGYYRQDLIYGEYQYIENGVEKINTLANIDIVYQVQSNHSISGEHIIDKYNYPYCQDCSENDLRLYGFIKDPLLDTSASITMLPVTVNGQQALKIRMRFDGIKYTPSPEDLFTTEQVGATINGEYILIKQ